VIAKIFTGSATTVVSIDGQLKKKTGGERSSKKEGKGRKQNMRK